MANTQEVAPGVHAIPLADDDNAPDQPRVYWVQGADRGALVNAGYGDPDRSQQLLDRWTQLTESLGKPPNPPLLLLTDRYGEHVDGATAFVDAAGAQVVLGRADVDALREDDSAVAALVDTPVDGGEELDLGGGRRLRVVPTPGHTPGAVSYLLDGERVLFTGDFILGTDTSTTVDPEAGGDMARHVASLHRARDLAPELILSFHGPPVTDPPARIDWLLERRSEREAQVLELLHGGVGDVDEMRDRMYEGLPEDLLASARAQVAAHLDKLAAEGRAEAVEPGRAYRPAAGDAPAPAAVPAPDRATQVTPRLVITLLAFAVALLAFASVMFSFGGVFSLLGGGAIGVLILVGWRWTTQLLRLRRPPS